MHKNALGTSFPRAFGVRGENPIFFNWLKHRNYLLFVWDDEDRTRGLPAEVSGTGLAGQACLTSPTPKDFSHLHMHGKH